MSKSQAQYKNSETELSTRTSWRLKNNEKDIALRTHFAFEQSFPGCEVNHAPNLSTYHQLTNRAS